MNATDSILRLGSRFGVLMLIAGAILWGIYHYGDKIGLNTLQAETLFLPGLRDPYSAFSLWRPYCAVHTRPPSEGAGGAIDKWSASEAGFPESPRSY